VEPQSEGEISIPEESPEASDKDDSADEALGEDEDETAPDL
jgi:hypothetical protein